MLTQAGITDSTTQLQINVILSCWSFVVAVSGSLLFDIFGRRKQTMGCYIGMIATLYIFGGLAKVYGTGSANNSGIYGTIAVLFLFQGFYAFSITPLSSLYPPEVLNLKTRTAGYAVYKFFNAGFGLLASFTMSYAMENLGWKFYFINASWNILFLAIVYFTWVETSRVPLEEIALRFGDINPDTIVDAVSVEESLSVEMDTKALEK
jgi:prepilin signal peptidase PulO-like enzyme (type II secretory pathway)